MIEAAVLLVYSLLVTTVVVPRLTGARWTERAPRLGLAVWQALTTGLVGAGVLAGVVVVGCGMPVGALGVLLAVTVVGRIAAVGPVTAWRTLRARAAHRAVVRLVGTFDPALDATVIPADSRRPVRSRHHHRRAGGARHPTAHRRSGP
jgi:hypothetical protein